MVEAYGGAPPWRRIAAWSGVFLLGLVLIVLAWTSRESTPGRVEWWTSPAIALGSLLMLASLVGVVLDRSRNAA